MVKRGFATHVFQRLIGSSQPELRKKKRCHSSLWMCVLFCSSLFCISAFAYTFKYNSGRWCTFGRTARRATRPEWIYSKGVYLEPRAGGKDRILGLYKNRQTKNQTNKQTNKKVPLRECRSIRSGVCGPPYYTLSLRTTGMSSC